MYNPPHFEESRPEELERIIAEYPLGTLVFRAPDGFDGAHLPFIYVVASSWGGRAMALWNSGGVCIGSL